MGVNRIKKILDDAVGESIITAEQAAKLHDLIKRSPGIGPTFDFTNVLYYLGGLIAIGAMTLFMNLGWESFGGWGILSLALAYAGVGLKLASVFQDKGHAIPAGIACNICSSYNTLGHIRIATRSRPMAR